MWNKRLYSMKQTIIDRDMAAGVILKTGIILVLLCGCDKNAMRPAMLNTLRKKFEDWRSTWYFMAQTGERISYLQV